MSEDSINMPAFPSCTEYFPNDVAYKENQGMTLRDYFAAKAMQGMVSIGIPSLKKDESFANGYARHAYDVADAMLRKRENNQQKENL